MIARHRVPVMAHELRNPLASLKGHAQLLAEDLGGSPKLHAKADRVVREAERLEALTTNLLDFDPFVTTRARGTGLGLAVARRIAEQHGGTLTGAARPDGGASFRLRFPNAA